MKKKILYRKKCTQCHEVKDIEEFYIRCTGSRYAECRTCFKARIKMNRAGQSSARYVHL